MKPLADPVERARAPGTGYLPEGGFMVLTPELDVTDLDASLRFWCDLLGFKVAFDRPAARFAYLARGGAQIMLCELNGRWMTGALERPYGRGVNFEITVDRLEPILTAWADVQWPLFGEPKRLGIVQVPWRQVSVSFWFKTLTGISCASLRTSGNGNRSSGRC